MGPSSGTYYIKNLSTKYFLHGTTGVQTGSRVTTDNVNATVFQVSESGGLYTISNQEDGMSVGFSTLPGASPDLLWQRGQYQWSITQQSAGVWNVRVPTENLYWFDNFKIGKWVTTKEGRTHDECNWQLIAA